MLRENLNEALKEAMRARDMTTVGAVRLILAKLKEVDIAARTEASRDVLVLDPGEHHAERRGRALVLRLHGGFQRVVELIAQHRGRIQQGFGKVRNLTQLARHGNR